eukprot:Blabericola_migrator_1__1615@NODE_1431_length_4555_cov_25_944519_g951_i0_p2_GENE_NODE_1431_length_4555_cov_25_944519_g951_i0NODE_1431_length_4555_cov_25_944519_g951_i0_p2_ORF_typecomplete_len144_score26_25RVT_1/PF00078_27/3_1e05_NODE_1431_length_4555_cov_25_944519_g951_i0335766
MSETTLPRGGNLSRETDAIVDWSITCKYLGKVALSKAYHSRPLEEDQMKFYGFEGPDGRYYQYKTMPMGAQGAPKHFHKVMSTFMSRAPEHLQTNTRSYRDDLFIRGDTEEDMIKISRCICRSKDSGSMKRSQAQLKSSPFLE